MKDKQIEEMAKVMLEASTNANVEPVFEMEGKEVVLGENATKVLNNILEQAFIPFLAEVLYNAGYLKASEVARDIFEEIMQAIESGVAEANKNITNSTPVFAFREVLLHTGEGYAGYIGKAICEVFKKYTEGGE